MIGVQIGDDLKPTLERDDLPLEVPLEDLLQSDADLLVEDLEDLFGCASSQQIAVHIQAGDRLSASLGRTEIEWLASFGIVFPWTSLDQDDVLDLFNQLQSVKK